MPRFGVESGTSRDTTIDGRVNFTKLFRDFTLSIASLLPKPVLVSRAKNLTARMILKTYL